MAYIPSRDADLINWGDNFTTKLTADPARYGVGASEAALVKEHYDEFVVAYDKIASPQFRTQVNVAEKDGTKALFLAEARAWAGMIRANRGVSNDDKIALGLNIPDPVPTPIPEPTTMPILNIIGATKAAHSIRFADSSTPDKRSKPFGVSGCVIYRKIAATPLTDPAGAELCQLATSALQEISTEGLPVGQIATYWARWYNRKGELGPLSDSASFIIA